MTIRHLKAFKVPKENNCYHLLRENDMSLDFMAVLSQGCFLKVQII